MATKKKTNRVKCYAVTVTMNIVVTDKNDWFHDKDRMQRELLQGAREDFAPGHLDADLSLVQMEVKGVTSFVEYDLTAATYNRLAEKDEIK